MSDRAILDPIEASTKIKSVNERYGIRNAVRGTASGGPTHTSDCADWAGY